MAWLFLALFGGWGHNRGMQEDASARERIAAYAFPEALVTTAWVAEHGHGEGVRLIECNEDSQLYDSGHLAGAVHLDWRADLQDPLVRDFIDVGRFARLCSRLGIGSDTLCVFYGDQSNWWACYALWAFRLFGHERVCILDGGRRKWVLEERPMTHERPVVAAADYPVPTVNAEAQVRAFYAEALSASQAGLPLVDVRTPGEYSGEILHMPEYPQEGALRGGHIPGAVNVPWSRAVQRDGTFRPRAELEEIYLGEAGLDPQKPVISYCRIGERSSHTWFVLTCLLGFAQVRNYDGSWLEWGNTVRAPISRG